MTTLRESRFTIKVTTTMTIWKGGNPPPVPLVYFIHEGESIEHNLLWRRNRPIQWYFDLLPTILRYAGMTITDEEASRPTTIGEWNQFAGCGCGCSPAIVLNRPGVPNLYVTIAKQHEVTEAGETSAKA